MADPYKAITAYLQTQSIATEGTNLFLAHTPPSPDTVLVLTPTPGIFDPNNIGHPYDKGTFQLLARGSYTEAYNLLTAAFNKLHNIGGVTLSGIYFVEIVALQNIPYFLEKDSLNRLLFIQNYRFEIKNPTDTRYE